MDVQNFSTASMRTKGIGMEAIKSAIDKLSKRHKVSVLFSAVFEGIT